MPVFEYRAISRAGRPVKGLIDADSAVGARRKLREQDLHPTRLEPASPKGDRQAEGGFSLRGASQRDISLMTRQMAVLLQAGMPLVESLTALLEQTANPKLRKAVFEVRDRVNEGAGLGDALEAQGRTFSSLYVNMVRAGEASGALEQVLFRLADVMERQVRLKQRVYSLLAYPFIMFSVSLGIIVFLMVVIVPKITQIFVRQEADLPWITTAVVATSRFVGHWWPALLLGLVLLGVGWRMWVARPAGRYAWDRFKLRVPLLGPLYQKMVCVRFARTLGTMLESGLTVMTALDVVKSIVQNRVIEDAMDDVKTGVRRGRELAQPLRETGLFPPMVLHMVELGQRSGEIESMLIKVADTYDEDVELTVNGVVSILEPLLIVFMGLFVGTLVISILLPVFRMSSNL